MIYYNPVEQTFITPGQFSAQFGVTPTEGALASCGYFPYVDPLEGQNPEPFFTPSGIVNQGATQLASYTPTAALLTLLNSLGGETNTQQSTPVGQILFFSTNYLPAGYLVCDGSLYQVADYPLLGGVLGNLYGGDGITTFAVPDLRGQFIRGWDAGAGVDPGRVFGSNQDDAFEAHAHFMAGNLGAAGSRIVAGTPSKTPDYTSGAPTQATGGTETRPKNVALLPCIFSGVFTPPPAPTYYGVINTGRGGGLGPEDLNPSYFTSFNASTGLTEAETELYIPGTDTVISYDAGLPPPYIFDSLGDCFASGDYTVEIRIAATSEVIGTFTCPNNPGNEDVSWGTAP